MESIRCSLCKKIFKRKKSQIVLAKKHYCSVDCQNVDRKKGRIISCYICHKKVYKKNRDVINSKSKNYFCSTKCSNQWLGSVRYGENHPNWINGKHSYKSIMSRSSSVKICKLCNENDTRILIVHHIDNNRENNSVINLVWLCHNCHYLVHHNASKLAELNKVLNNKDGNK